MMMIVIITPNDEVEFGMVSTYPTPAMPSTTKLLLVNVPVLSKQHTCTLPANGIRNGSVQYTSKLDFGLVETRSRQEAYSDITYIISIVIIKTN